MPDEPEHEAVTQRAMIDEGDEALHAAGVEDARQESRWITEEVLGISGAQMAAHPDRAVTPSERTAIRHMLERRTDGEPLQYVLGHADFRELRLRVTPEVMIPRPETEGVVEVVLAALKSRKKTFSPRVLDIGTGSGCIALAVKDECAGADVHACDVSAGALRVARDNAERHELEVTCFRADVLADDFPAQMAGDFDVVVSNPPYVVDAERELLPSSVVDYEPAESLFSGEDPLRFYRVICHHARRLLRDEGALVFEVHVAYGSEVVKLCESNGLRDVQLRRDLSGRWRVVTARRG